MSTNSSHDEPFVRQAHDLDAGFRSVVDASRVHFEPIQEQLYGRIREFLVKHLAREHPNDQAADLEDVAHNAIVKILTKNPETTKFWGWLKRAAKGHYIDHHRQATRRRTREDSYTAQRPASNPDSADHSSDFASSLAAFGVLTAKDIEVVRYRLEFDMEWREIAKRLRTTSSALRTRFSRAMSKLREHHNKESLALLLCA